MSFLRFLSRSLLASFFVADGLKAAIDPAPLVEDAEPLATTVTDVGDRFLPEWAAHRIPRKTETLVRIHGGVEALGGIMLSTGVFRRAGAVLVALAYLPKVASMRPSLLDFTRLDFLRELALLGAVLIAAGDTGGEPSRSWLSSHKKWAKKQARIDAKIDAKAARTTSATRARQTKALGDALSSATR